MDILLANGLRDSCVESCRLQTGELASSWSSTDTSAFSKCMQQLCSRTGITTKNNILYSFDNNYKQNLLNTILNGQIILAQNHVLQLDQILFQLVNLFLMTKQIVKMMIRSMMKYLHCLLLQILVLRLGLCRITIPS